MPHRVALTFLRQVIRVWPDILSALLFGVLLVIAFQAHQDYGITWDERSHQQYGDYVVSVLGALGQGELPEPHPRWGKYPYGGAYDVLGAAARWISPLPEHDTLHLLGALVGIFGIVGAWWLGRLLGGPVAALASAFLLSTTPVYFGHMFNNPKDVPFAAGYIWALAAICALIRSLPAVSRSQWMGLTLACGLATCVRPAGGIVIAYLLVALVAFSLRQGLTQQSARVAWQYLRGYVGACIGVAVGTWICLIAFYPAALLQPFGEPIQAVQQLSYYRRFIPIMRFDGQTITSFEVPWDYLPTYFVMKLPELHLFALGFAVGLAVIWIVNKRPWYQWRVIDRRVACLGILTLSILIPPLTAIALGSALYDGLRHFLFIIPPLAVVAGLTVAHGLQKLRRPGFGIAILVIMCLDLVRTMIVLHPHEYVYFNRLVGGLSGVAGAYETDYYGNSHREAFDGLAEALWTENPREFLSTDFVIDGCLSRYAAMQYMRPNMRLVPPTIEDEPRAASDFFLADRRLFCTEFSSPQPVISRVERQGTTLSFFLDRRTP